MQNDATALEQDDILQALDALQSYLLEAGEDIAEVVVSRAADEIARLREEVDVLREALSALHHAVCGETGFAAAVRADSGLAYPWPVLDAADEQARKALENRNHLKGQTDEA